MRRVIFLATVTLTLIGSTAFAGSLNGRFGITGKGGALVPLNDDFIGDTSKSRTGFATGGGLIFGFCRDFAAEIDVTHVPKLDVEVSGHKVYEATLTDVALGVQYRVPTRSRMVPFFGAGVDFVRGELKYLTGTKYDLDWTVGGHIDVGADYFLTRGIALTADLRGVAAAEGDIESGDIKRGHYQPMSFIGTVGVRLILPEISTW